MANTAFAKAFANKAKKTFAEAKKYKHRAGNNFGPADVPDGTFTAVVTIEASVPTKGSMEGIPIVRVVAAINEGQHEGKEPSQSYFCEGKPIDPNPKAMPTAEQQLLGLLGFLLPDIDIEDETQVPQAIAMVNERGPICVVGVKNTTKNDKKYQNVYFNKLIQDKSFTQEGNKAEAAEEEGAGDEGTNLEYVPARKDEVTMLDHDGEWEVAAVSQSRQTANVVSKDDPDTKINGVPWTDLTLI